MRPDALFALVLVGVALVAVALVSEPTATLRVLGSERPQPSPTGDLPRDTAMTYPTAGASPQVGYRAPASDLRTYERAIFEEVNRRRVKAGADPLIWDDGLAATARAHSEDMARRGYLDHTSPEGITPWARIGSGGSSENIALTMRPLTIKQVVDMWMVSPSHRVNIMRVESRRAGVGAAFMMPGDYVTYDGEIARDYPAKYPLWSWSRSRAEGVFVTQDFLSTLRA